MAGDLDLGKDYSKLPDILEYYENEYKTFKEDVSMKGKTIERISLETPSFFAYYSERLSELKKILAFMESQVAQKRGQIYKGIKKTSQVALGEREIARYVDADEIYIDVHTCMLEVKEMHDMFASAVESFRVVGYSMNNIVKARVAEISEMTL